MSIWTWIGGGLVLALMVGIGLLSGRRVKSAKDFLAGGQAGPLLVCGTILGSLVSSQATIGTAQLAFHYGLAAWWFTLGSGAGCLILALGYVKGLRRSGCITELQIISREYGTAAGSLGSVLCSIGIFISVLAQVVACVGLITILFPAVSITAAAAVSIAAMCVYVIFGGTWGAGMGGVVKLLLLYLSSIAGLLYVLAVSGGLGGIRDGLHHLLAGTELGLIQETAAGLGNLTCGADIADRFANLVARGPMKDIGSGLSLLLGVLSTQTYAQGVWSAKSDRAARRGALLSACLIPPIGIAGICIGLYMRIHYITQAEVDALLSLGREVPNLPVLSSTIQVFPAFVNEHLPPLAAGVVLGTLLITVVGGGAGLSLGMATILVKDILRKIRPSTAAPAQELRAVRMVIAAILIAAAAVAALIPSSTINDLGFLSMGLRGAVVFAPLSCALWFPGRIGARWILASIILSPCAVLLGKLLQLPFDALYLGLGVSVVCCAAGWGRRAAAGRPPR